MRTQPRAARRMIAADFLQSAPPCSTGTRGTIPVRLSLKLRRGMSSLRVMGRSLNRFELIESYPEDKYHPSYFVWGSDGSRIFHVVFAVDMKMDNVRAVTAYFPELGK